MKLIDLSVFVLITFLMIHQTILAAEVSAVSGKDVQIKLTAEDFLEPNEMYFLINEKKKRAGIVNIVEVNETKGKSVLLKGSAQPGYTLQLYVPPKKRANPVLQNTTVPISKDYLGVYADLMMNQMSLTYGETSIDLKGQGFGLAFGYQKSLSSELNIRYSLGYRTFLVKAEDVICPQNSCEINVGYAALGARINYFLNETFFASAGLDYLSPVNKSSTVLTLEQIESNSTAVIGAGFMLDSQFLVSVGYNHFLQNKNAKASFISLQVGYIWPF